MSNKHKHRGHPVPNDPPVPIPPPPVVSPPGDDRDKAFCDTCPAYSSLGDKGECRAQPPTLIPTATGPRTVFPIVGLTDWCALHPHRRHV